MINIIDVDKIKFSYTKKQIYNSFSLSFCENEITFIMGNNGSGKTTLLNLITGFLKPSEGEIRIFNKNISEYDSKELAKKIAYVPQSLKQSIDFIVKDYLSLGRSPYIKFGGSPSKKDYEIVEHYSRWMGIQEFLECNYNELSGGQKQMISITKALIQDTPIIVMDEPMSALDLGKQAELLTTLKKLKDIGKTVILTSHNPNHALLFKCNVCLIHENSILGFGSNTEVLKEYNIEKVYGKNVCLDKKSNTVIFKTS